MHLKILGFHGLGDHRHSCWKADWEKAVRSKFPEQDQIELQFRFVNYDHIFEGVDISDREVAEAIAELCKSFLSSMYRRRKGFLHSLNHHVKWTAGYVVAWLADNAFQSQCRDLVIKNVSSYIPDIVLAHSLGSLITYNTFSHPEKEEIVEHLKRVNYVTFGSQIGNPFVMGNLTPGRIEPLELGKWYHLYNSHDHMFTAPIRLFGCDNFEQVDTDFDIKGFFDHSPVNYLQHAATAERVWRPITRKMLHPTRSDFPSRQKIRTTNYSTRPIRRPRHRALLIGINEYPSDIPSLEGCANDVFLISSVLQEWGFPPECIRTCLDERATADGIMQRLEWLVDDPRQHDRLVFYFSGHGAQIPTYDKYREPDRMNEALVPWDFDWSEAKAITDDQIFELYSQLPYDTQFTMIFDCCHSGGIHREGGQSGKRPESTGRHPPPSDQMGQPISNVGSSRVPSNQSEIFRRQ